MDLDDKEKFSLENDGENHLSFNTSGISSAEWQMGLHPANNTSMAPCQGTQMASSQCPPDSLVDSFFPALWDHPSNSQSLGFTGTVTATGNVPIVKPLTATSWSPTDPMTKGGGGFCQPGGIGILAPGLSQFPADSAFIERAVRFSCFGGANFTGGMSLLESSNPYVSTPPGAGVGGAAQAMKGETNMGESSKDLAGMCADGQGSNAGSPMNSQKGTGNSHGVAEHGEPEFSGNGQEETPSSKGLAAKKRKRDSQEMEIDQAKEEPDQPAETYKDTNDVRQNEQQNKSTVGTTKKNGKQAKDGSDPPKDYIHVRARRGQATNSHSLAERVRREKISERMKFLQELVPGCSKVTGKAVMLDEIINYVQSLQRQVEFLSMKLAAVNPHLDFNIEGLLSKDMLQSRGSSSTAMGFSPDLARPFLHPSSHGLTQPGISGMVPPSEAFRRAANSPLISMNPYKDAKHQMINSWDDELHNVLSQMGFGNNLPFNFQESNDKPRDGFPL